MEKATIDILATAISDVGYWRWWVVENDTCQLEFGGVQLLNGDLLCKESKSAVIALQYRKNDFLVFYDKLSDTDWYKKLQNDKINPFVVDYDFFIFNDFGAKNEIENEYKNKHTIKEINNIGQIKNVLIFKAGQVAVIIGGDEFRVIDQEDIVSEEKIVERNKLWWSFWKDYWQKRETTEAYNKDYVCEVTIPIKG